MANGSGQLVLWPPAAPMAVAPLVVPSHRPSRRCRGLRPIPCPPPLLPTALLHDQLLQVFTRSSGRTRTGRAIPSQQSGQQLRGCSNAGVGQRCCRSRQQPAGPKRGPDDQVLPPQCSVLGALTSPAWKPSRTPPPRYALSDELNAGALRLEGDRAFNTIDRLDDSALDTLLSGR